MVGTVGSCEALAVEASGGTVLSVEQKVSLGDLNTLGATDLELLSTDGVSVVIQMGAPRRPSYSVG